MASNGLAPSRSAKLMPLAHPPPLVGAGIARPKDGRSSERPMGGGSRRPSSHTSPLPCCVGRRDPPPRSSPTIGRPKDARPLDELWGEETRRNDPRAISGAKGAKTQISAGRSARKRPATGGSAKPRLAAQAIATALKPVSKSVRTVPRPNALIPRSDNRRFGCIMPQRRQACHRRRSRCLSACGRALSARCRVCAPFATFGRDSGRARSE
jgi:hypothetical protein